MYAIVRTGGKQYRVEEGRSISVERLPVEEGATAELADVLLIADNGNVTVGTPTIEGARVLAQVEEHGRGDKIIVFKYKAKVRARKKTGHRQSFTRLAIQQILRPGEEARELEKPKRRRARKATEEAEPEAAAPAEPPELEAEAAPAAEPEAKPKTPRRRTTRRATPKAEAEPAGEAEPKPKTPRRRAARKADDGEQKPTTRRRTSRRKTEDKETE